MKKLFVLIVISLACYGASSAQVRVGGMLGYGTEVEQWGLGLTGEFFLNEKMSIAPGLLFYFPEKNNGVKVSVWELNGNFQYYFVTDEPVSVYGLAGLNLTTVKVKFDDTFPGTADNSESELGLNLGIGANFHVGNVLPFAELKYVAGDIDQAVISLGVKFPMGAD
jgi:outer membrane immunogenic protein